MSSGKYHTIYADPPWPLRGGKNGKSGWSTKASPHVHYPLMTVPEIASMPIWEIAEDDCHLWLWVPNCMLPQGLAVMKAWGFDYKNNVAWEKLGPPGLGQYIRTTHELCLFGTKGRIPYARSPIGKRQQIKSSFSAKKTRHSAKPPQMRQMIEVVSPGPRVELFARERAEGWDAWGNQVPHSFEFTTEV